MLNPRWLTALFVLGCSSGDVSPDLSIQDSLPTAVTDTTATQTDTDSNLPLPSNILVIIADDLGVDKVEAFGTWSNPPPTPNLTEHVEACVVWISVAGKGRWERHF